ncbi:MAG: hypothetical protein V3W31_09660 [Thermodesulfobacteriota bacterium]
MSALWRTNGLDELWESAPTSAGIYIIKCNKVVRRVAGQDHSGILYIGKSIKLRRRLKRFIDFNHIASGFLWENREVAGGILGERCQSDEDYLIEQLGKLKVKFSTINKSKLEEAERAVLHAYVRKFGEVPPLNNSLPKRWSKEPSKNSLCWASWARRGLK